MAMTAGFTHTGKVRNLNEDCFTVKDNFALVSDGMGGHNKGERASLIVSSKLTERLEKLNKKDVSSIITAISDTNKDVYIDALNEPDRNGMGATLVMAYWEDNSVIIANVGDSRCYKISNGTILQITKDHSLVQTLVDKGEMTKEQAKKSDKKHYIYRAMGTEEIIQPDIFQITVSEGDILVLCSDGLTNMLEDTEILNICEKEKSPQGITEKLVNSANDKGGTDNITVVAVMF